MPLSAESVRVLDRLLSFKPPTSNIDVGWSARASVLVLLYGDENGELRVVLTTRSQNMRSHKGEVSLPGGKAEEGEGVWDTARREAFEEIGLPIKDSEFGLKVEQLACLPPHLSRTHLIVTPCIAHLSSSIPSSRVVPVLNPKEVRDVFTIPLKRFLSREGHSGRWISWFDKRWAMHEFAPATREMHFVCGERRDDERPLIWGLTARILVETAWVGYGVDPEFEVDLQLGDVELIRGMTNEEFGRGQGKREEQQRHRL